MDRKIESSYPICNFTDWRRAYNTWMYDFGYVIATPFYYLLTEEELIPGDPVP